MKKGVSLFLILIFLGICAASEAARDRWVLLGQKRVSYWADRDVINVSRSNADYKRLLLHVRDAGVRFGDINVTFANGRTVDIPIRNFIPRGGRSRVIDLPGRARDIERVELIYATRYGARDRARVEVWALRD